LLKAASQDNRCRLALVESEHDPDPNRGHVDTVLLARVEELRLEKVGAGDTSFALRIKVRTRLVRMSDGAVLYDQPAEYRSGTCLFLDWTLHNAFQSVADTGYRALAEQIAAQILSTSATPLLAGAGYKRAPLPPRYAPVTLASNIFPAKLNAVQPVSYAVAGTGTLEVFPTATIPGVVFQLPPSREEAVSEAVRDTEWVLDGLDEHPNPLVYLPAMAAAVPIGLCNQGAAMIGGFSPKKLGKVAATLKDAANRAPPRQALALEVAQQLALQTLQPVMLVKQPSWPREQSEAVLVPCVSQKTLACRPENQKAGGNVAGQAFQIALEIHVERATLKDVGGIKSKLALCVEAQGTLWRGSDGQQIFSYPVRYRSEARKVTQWAAHDAKLFREELQKCYRELSAALVDQLIAGGITPQNHQPQILTAQR